MFKSTSSFDRLLERATSHLLLEPDWNAILAICDTIRSGDVAPKYAVSAIKKKFYHENPHVVLYALQVNFPDNTKKLNSWKFLQNTPCLNCKQFIKFFLGN